jgi:hypothetical protein
MRRPFFVSTRLWPAARCKEFHNAASSPSKEALRKAKPLVPRRISDDFEGKTSIIFALRPACVGYCWTFSLRE